MKRLPPEPLEVTRLLLALAVIALVGIGVLILALVGVL